MVPASSGNPWTSPENHSGGCGSVWCGALDRRLQTPDRTRAFSPPRKHVPDRHSSMRRTWLHACLWPVHRRGVAPCAVRFASVCGALRVCVVGKSVRRSGSKSAARQTRSPLHAIAYGVRSARRPKLKEQNAIRSLPSVFIRNIIVERGNTRHALQ